MCCFSSGIGLSNQRSTLLRNSPLAVRGVRISLPTLLQILHLFLLHKLNSRLYGVALKLSSLEKNSLMKGIFLSCALLQISLLYFGSYYATSASVSTFTSVSLGYSLTSIGRQTGLDIICRWQIDRGAGTRSSIIVVIERRISHRHCCCYIIVIIIIIIIIIVVVVVVALFAAAVVCNVIVLQFKYVYRVVVVAVAVVIAVVV